MLARSRSSYNPQSRARAGSDVVGKYAHHPRRRASLHDGLRSTFAGRVPVIVMISHFSTAIAAERARRQRRRAPPWSC
jgi:hypothetical protein